MRAFHLYRRGLALALVAIALVQAPCAYAVTPQGTSSGSISSNQALDNQDEQDSQNLDADPLEGINRPIYKFNYVFDKYLLRPVTVGYRYVVPPFGRNMVSNFLTNLYSPVTFANSVLQADPQNSFATFFRFVINTTFGVGGMFDVAGSGGLTNRPADFGETLAFYGVGKGPFIFIPLLGPSDVRDGFGDLTDAFINPLPYISTTADYSVWGATAVDFRSKNMSILDSTFNNSLDPYVTFRSLYLQKRDSDIRRAEASRKAALAQQTHNP